MFLSPSALFNFSFWRDGEKNDPPGVRREEAKY